MSKEWDRTDYIEEDVRRHSDELRTLIKVTQENSTALNILLTEMERFRNDLKNTHDKFERELDRRSGLYKDHEERLREIEAWKSRSVAYWAIVTAVVGTAAGLLLPVIRNLISHSN